MPLVKTRSPSESKPRYQLKRARVTREEPNLGRRLIVLPKEGAARDQESAVDCAGGERGHIVEPAANELRVIEKVERLSADIETEPLGEIDALGQCHIEVVGMVERESIASAVGARARSSHDVARVGVIGNIGDDVATRADLPGRIVPGYAAAEVCGPGWVDDGAVSRAIAVQVGIDAALHGGELRRLKRVGAANVPVAHYVFHKPFAVLERLEIEDRSKGKPMAVIQS